MIVEIENLFSTEEQKYFDYISLYNKDRTKVLHRQKLDMSAKINSFIYNRIEFLVNIENGETNVTLESLNKIVYAQNSNQEVELSEG